jgi:hypothetical protein
MHIFNLLRKPFPNDLIAGLFYMGSSYIPYLFPPRDYGYWGSLIFGALYYIGAIYLAVYAIHKMSGRPILHEIIGTNKRKLNFVKIGLIGAVPFSLAVCDFGAFWYFPYWSPAMYYAFGYLFLGWVFYFLFLTVCYIAFKMAIDQLLPQKNKVKKYYAFEVKNYRALGVMGGWIAVMVITVGLQNAGWLTHFNFAVNKPEKPFLYWYWWLIAAGGWILLCEFVEYRKRRSSLFKDTLHGYLNPLIAVLLCGVTLAITNETQNLRINLWAYANYPWPGTFVFGVPLFVVVGWPVHIVAFIEFWRAFGNERATDVLFANAAVRKAERRHRRPKTVKRAVQA